jgi:hypothetical protein
MIATFVLCIADIVFLNLKILGTSLKTRISRGIFRQFRILKLERTTGT